MQQATLYQKLKLENEQLKQDTSSKSESVNFPHYFHCHIITIIAMYPIPLFRSLSEVRDKLRRVEEELSDKSESIQALSRELESAKDVGENFRLQLKVSVHGTGNIIISSHTAIS